MAGLTTMEGKRRENMLPGWTCILWIVDAVVRTDMVTILDSTKFEG